MEEKFPELDDNNLEITQVEEDRQIRYQKMKKLHESYPRTREGKGVKSSFEEVIAENF